MSTEAQFASKKRIESGNSGNGSPENFNENVPNPNYRYFSQNYSINTKFQRCPHLQVKILNEEIEGLADTGAGVSIISSLELIEKLGLQIQRCNVKIRTADSTEYTCTGYVNVPYTYQDLTRVIPTIIVPQVSKEEWIS